MTKPLHVPTIHGNGTLKTELIEQLSKVLDGLRSAKLALHDAAPHGRDYPVFGDHRIALDTYNRRLAALRTMIIEFDRDVIEIAAQHDPRCD